MRIPVIVGATASGKTGVAIELAKRIDGEIISADSMQIYKTMNIGTAKPTVEETEGIPHHLIDCVAPDENFSVARFVQEAEASIAEIMGRGKCPIVVGGTGLYINGLTLPWSFETEDTNPKVRARLEREIKKVGSDSMHRLLERIDPESAKEIHPNNAKRIVRALEIYEVTGMTKSQSDTQGQHRKCTYEYTMMGLRMDRQQLYKNIDRRVDNMIAAGLLDEVQALINRGYSRDLVSLKAIGYKEFFPYFDGEMSFDETLRILKRDTRHFAKRQLTWFRKDQRIKWFDVNPESDAGAVAEEMLSYCASVDCER